MLHTNLEALGVLKTSLGFAAFCLFAVYLEKSYAETGPLGWGKANLLQDLETDRPDFTEGTQTVDPGHIQFEGGYTYAKDGSGVDQVEEHALPEILARIGIVEDLELRLAWEGYIYTDQWAGNESGVTDLNLGFKERFFAQSNLLPKISAIGALFVPVGSSEYTSDDVIPEAKILWAYDFERFGVGGNVNFAGPIGKEGRYLEVASSIAIGADISRKVGSYFEYFGIYPAESVPETDEHYLNGGLTFAFTDNIQFDIRAGVGINGDAADLFSGVGVAYRL